MAPRVAPGALALAALLAMAARAEPDAFGVGTGRDGPLTVTSGTSVIVNPCWNLAASADAGASSVRVVGAGQLAPFSLVMFHQTSGVPDPGAPDASVLDYASSPVGRWELARIAGQDGGIVNLTAPLAAGFGAPSAQLVLVPEYTTVTVQAGAEIRAPPWDGGCGGVAAFLASTAVDSSGTVTADSAGFRAGPAGTWASMTGCVDPNEPPPWGARKGEGLVPSRFDANATGWGSVTIGAGGGVCRNAGGGGGGSAGSGGQGGNTDGQSDGSRPFGGRGGAVALVAPLPSQLLFGGGGGAGHLDAAGDTHGGAGGGVVFARASAFVGSGRYSASGEQAPDTLNGGIGSGGGGGGGTVALLSAGGADCGLAAAVGGDGGSTQGFGTGPGGGGAGGRILIVGQPLACAATVEGGIAGISGDAGHLGAEPSLAARDAGAGRGIVTLQSAPYAPGADGGCPVAPDSGCGPAGLGQLNVGCDCGSRGGSLLALMALVLAPLARWRRRSTGST